MMNSQLRGGIAPWNENSFLVVKKKSLVLQVYVALQSSIFFLIIYFLLLRVNYTN